MTLREQVRAVLARYIWPDDEGERLLEQATSDVVAILPPNPLDGTRLWDNSDD